MIYIVGMKMLFTNSLRKPAVLLLLLVWQMQAQAQTGPTIQPLPSTSKASLRGLSVVSDNIVWVSGSGGTVGRSADGGKNWKWMQVKGFEKTDFRDIEAFNEKTAVIMGIAEPAYILRTEDGGENWKVVYKNETPGMFLDAMDFLNGNTGTVVGDPINGKLFVAETNDGGRTWRDLPEDSRPVADSGEAFFAASGTNIKMLKENKAVLVTGGLSSHLVRGRKKTLLPLLQGKESTGANSVAVRMKNGDVKLMAVAGGDFSNDTLVLNNFFYSRNGGKTWKAPQTKPKGYRSCVAFINKGNWIACGTSGVDISFDGCKNWQLISPQGYHVVQKAKKGNAVFLAGGNGRIAKLQW